MKSANKAILAEIQKRSRDAVEIGGEGLKQELRDMTSGPLGDKVAKTWRLKFYGMRGGNPAAFIWTKAPRIIEGNIKGGNTVPVLGSKYLAIPTKSVPRRIGGRGAKSKMSPEEVEVRYNQDMIIRRGRKAGTLLGFVDMNVGYRGKRNSKRQRLVLMFTFVKSVRRRKTIDPQSAFVRWSDRTAKLLGGT